MQAPHEAAFLFLTEHAYKSRFCDVCRSPECRTQNLNRRNKEHATMALGIGGEINIGSFDHRRRAYHRSMRVSNASVETSAGEISADVSSMRWVSIHAVRMRSIIPLGLSLKYQHTYEHDEETQCISKIKFQVHQDDRVLTPVPIGSEIEILMEGVYQIPEVIERSNTIPTALPTHRMNQVWTPRRVRMPTRNLHRATTLDPPFEQRVAFMEENLATSLLPDIFLMNLQRQQSQARLVATQPTNSRMAVNHVAANNHRLPRCDEEEMEDNNEELNRNHDPNAEHKGDYIINDVIEYMHQFVIDR